MKVELELIKYNDGVIIKCRNNGDYLIEITKDGEFKRWGGVSPNKGFKLDDEGKIVIC
jgi:hypothetical protein